jgi:hypothetical protein
MMQKLMKGNLLCKVRGGTGAVCWKGKQEVYLVTSTTHQLIIWTMREMSRNFQ